MVSLDDRRGTDPSRGDSPVDLSGRRAGWRGQGPLESVPVILGMPAEFMRALEDLDAVGSTDERSLDGVVHVAEVLHVTAKRLRLVFEQARTELRPTHNESMIAGLHTASLPIIRAALAAAAADLAGAVDEGAPGAWALTACEGDRVVSAETLLREALDDAHDHLQDLRRMVQAATPPAHNG
jgi:hypothetical protein